MDKNTFKNGAAQTRSFSYAVFLTEYAEVNESDKVSYATVRRRREEISPSKIQQNLAKQARQMSQNNYK